MAEIELRTYTFLDSMQPQFAAFLGTTARGYLPVQYQAALFVEIAPGIAINKLTDVALKKNSVQPGVQVVERAYGLLEVHSDSQAEVRSAGEEILKSVGLEERARLKPKVTASQVVTNVHPYQAQLINRGRFGNMLLGGNTLYILEVHPAGYAVLAANEAEKASPVSLIDMQFFGAFGRLYLGGSESEIAEAVPAVLNALNNVDGRDNK